MRTYRTIASLVLLAVTLAACTGGATPPAVISTTAAPAATNTRPAPTQAAPTSEPQITAESVQSTDTAAPSQPTDTTVPTQLATLTPWPVKDTPTAGPTEATAAALPQASSSDIIIDHNSVALFEQIPDEYLEKARALHVIFYNASVGLNVSEGLDCLTAASWSQAPAHCRRDYSGSFENWQTFQGNPQSATAAIAFNPDPVKYDRSNWVYGRYPGDWRKVTTDFINQQVPKDVATYDVLSFKFTYLMVADNSDITDPNRGFFAEQSGASSLNAYIAMMKQYPDKRFFLWTSSLSRSIGTQVSTDFNDQLRRAALENDIPLFDMADIESHDPDGQPCYDNRDAVKYCSNSGECEDNPDDGQNLPALCQNYTTEIEGGHLGSVSGGKIRAAKAFWVLIARLAGWNPPAN